MVWQKRFGLLGLLAALMLPAAEAEIYTWLDAQGRTHYGDTPPADLPIRRLSSDPGSLSTIGDTALRESERELLDRFASSVEARDPPRSPTTVLNVLVPGLVPAHTSGNGGHRSVYPLVYPVYLNGLSVHGRDPSLHHKSRHPRHRHVERPRRWDNPQLRAIRTATQRLLPQRSGLAPRPRPEPVRRQTTGPRRGS